MNTSKRWQITKISAPKLSSQQWQNSEESVMGGNCSWLMHKWYTVICLLGIEQTVKPDIAYERCKQRLETYTGLDNVR